MATTTYGTEYVQSSDLVSNWPGSSLSVANRIDDVSLKGNGVNNQTGTSYTLVLADGGKLVTFSNAAAVSLTVPTNASVAFPTGVQIKLTNKGAGTVTVVGAGGVTLNGNLLTMAQNRSAMLYKLDTNTWVMTADESVPSDPGLAFITSSTFSASAAVNVNNCFNSTYDHYRIVIANLSQSVAGNMRIRMRASGSDDTTANYSDQYFAADGTTNTANREMTQTSGRVAYVGTSVPQSMSMDIYSPSLATQTTWTSFCEVNASNSPAIVLHGGWHNVSTAYDGFTLLGQAGNISGTLRVYGYRNS